MTPAPDVVGDRCERPAITVSFLKAAECSIASGRWSGGSRWSTGLAGVEHAQDHDSNAIVPILDISSATTAASSGD